MWYSIVYVSDYIYIYIYIYEYINYRMPYCSILFNKVFVAPPAPVRPDTDRIAVERGGGGSDQGEPLV